MEILTPVKRAFKPSGHIFKLIFLTVFLGLILGGSSIPPAGHETQVRAFTRPIEFEFGFWTFEALLAKFSGWGLSLEHYLPPQKQTELVLAYVDQLQLVNSINAEILTIYTNPNISSPDVASQPLRQALQVESKRLSTLTALAEGILQNQLMSIIEENGLGFLGQALPPSLFRISDIPQSLIISPRTEIFREMDISLQPGLNLDFIEQLEDAIFTKLDRSALVVPIGGIGTYPTMVMQSTDLMWLTDTIAHEWVHNYLSLRPLGINYFTSGELRTINETTASLAGTELGWLLMEKYYPDYIPPNLVHPRLRITPAPITVEPPDPHVFNFQLEMRQTRVETDRLLAEGDVIGAEAYMEARRQYFWRNGYQIRKINQAYFAFYGAYSDDPAGGAAGEDPVGLAVQALYAQSPHLADFLNTISWVTSFDGLLSLLNT